MLPKFLIYKLKFDQRINVIRNTILATDPISGLRQEFLRLKIFDFFNSLELFIFILTIIYKCANISVSMN